MRGVVALRLLPDLDLVVTMLALAKAGLAYLPLAPEWPQGRLELLIDEVRWGREFFQLYQAANIHPFQTHLHRDQCQSRHPAPRRRQDLRREEIDLSGKSTQNQRLLMLKTVIVA